MRQTLGAAALLLVGCTGDILGGSGAGGANLGASGAAAGTSGGSNGAGGSAALTCTDTQTPAPSISARIRRLTRLELENSLVDLVGEAARPLAHDIEADTFAIGYSTGDERGVSSNYVDALKSVAERAAAERKNAVESQALGPTCQSDAASAKTCAQTFLQDFGQRALRRPLEKAELDGLLKVFEAGRATAPAGDTAAALNAGLDYATRALLQSPSFVFRTELGPVGAPAGPVKLTAYETAAAISFALTASPPDAELMQEAKSDALTTPEQLDTQARRLLSAYPERFAIQTERFVREWLGIDTASPAWNKDNKLYPEASASFKAALDKETELFLRDWATSGSFEQLLTKPQSFVSKANAPAYGMLMPSADFTKVALDGSQRAGILTLPSYLGSRAHTDASSPVLRGVAIMKRFLCLEPPPVPAMVPPLPPADKSAAKTTRERFAQHTALEFCSACHQNFDPMGNAFEHYDAIGRYRTEENGVAVDSSGALVGTSTDGPVADAVELSKLLAASPEVHSCFVRQTYRFSVGRKETEADACRIDALSRQFADKNLDLRELMLALVTAKGSFERVAVTPDP